MQLTTINNKIMKKLILSVFSIITLNSFAQTIELKLASDIWPPFTNVENEKSFASDLVKEALTRNNINSSIEMTVFNDVITGIDSGKYDGSAALWISDERKEKYLFSEPYLHNQLVLVGRKGSKVGAISFSELKGKRIGIIDNYEYGDFNASEDITLISGKNNQDNLENLLTEKIDFMLVDALIIQYILKYQLNDVSKYLEIGSTPLIVKSLHFAIRKDIVDGANIIIRFNEEIDNMIKDGSYHRILELNWIRTDIDGDGKFEIVLEGDKAGVNSPKNIYGLMLDTSYSENTNAPKRYFIDGKLYEDWDNIPKTYKLDLIKDNTPSSNDAVMKLKFN
jgi:ABC-type amino acid transport substrate-binding protein